MLIKVTVEVDIDPAKWVRDNGVDHRQVRADVARYVRNSVAELPAVRDAEPDK